MLHVRMIEDSIGDLVDIDYYCSQYCALKADVPQPSAWPGGMETDYDQYCGNCETLIARGLSYYDDMPEDREAFYNERAEEMP